LVDERRVQNYRGIVVQEGDGFLDRKEGLPFTFMSNVSS